MRNDVITVNNCFATDREINSLNNQCIANFSQFKQAKNKSDQRSYLALAYEYIEQSYAMARARYQEKSDEVTALDYAITCRLFAIIAVHYNKGNDAVTALDIAASLFLEIASQDLVVMVEQLKTLDHLCDMAYQGNHGSILAKAASRMDNVLHLIERCYPHYNVEHYNIKALRLLALVSFYRGYDGDAILAIRQGIAAAREIDYQAIPLYQQEAMIHMMSFHRLPGSASADLFKTQVEQPFWEHCFEPHKKVYQQSRLDSAKMLLEDCKFLFIIGCVRSLLRFDNNKKPLSYVLNVAGKVFVNDASSMAQLRIWLSKEIAVVHKCKRLYIIEQELFPCLQRPAVSITSSAYDQLFPPQELHQLRSSTSPSLMPLPPRVSASGSQRSVVIPEQTTPVTK